MDIKAILVFKIFLANITHERLTIAGMNILYVPLDVVMFDHFATQNTLIPSVHTPHKSLWKIRQLVNSFWRNSMGFSEMAEPMMPCFKSHTTNITRKVQRQVESFNVLLKIGSLCSHGRYKDKWKASMCFLRSVLCEALFPHSEHSQHWFDTILDSDATCSSISQSEG